jgi:excisionase family DNA binding protein
VLPITNKAAPSLDQIASDPKLAGDLDEATVVALLGPGYIAVAALEARRLVLSVGLKEHATAKREPASRLMTATEVAERLGFKLAYIYELARGGKIRSLQEGKYIRFTEAALSEYIATNDSSVDFKLSDMLSVTRDTRTVQRRPRRSRPHANGNGAAPGRASDDG